MEGIGDKCSLWDGPGGYTRNGFDFGKLLKNGVDNFELHIVAQIGIGKGLSIIAVER